jgi:sugar lactone lactonase YvrE
MPTVRLIIFATIVCGLFAQQTETCKLTTVVGSATDDAGDGGPPLESQLSNISATAYDAAGNLYIATGRKIRVVTTEGIIWTFAGTGKHGYHGDDGPAVAASFRSISGMRIDSKGNVYVSDSRSHVVRRIEPSGTIVTVAGTGRAGFNGHEGQGTSLQLNRPSSLAIDPNDNVYIADSLNYIVRRLSPDGRVETVAGTGEDGPVSAVEDGAVATQVRINAAGIAVDAAGALLILNWGRDVLSVNAGRITRVIGNVASYPEGPLPQVTLSLSGIAVSPSGDLYLEQSPLRVPSTTPWLRFTGNGSVVPVPGSASKLVGFTPDGLPLGAFDAGVLFRVEEGKAIAVAGASSAGFSGDGGPGTGAQLSNPTALAADPDGALYIVDAANWRVRRLSPDGIISTYYSSGDQSYVPLFVTADEAGNVYVGSSGLGRIRKIDRAGSISLILGGGMIASDRGPMPAVEAAIPLIQSLQSDASGNLFLHSLGFAGYWLIEAGTGLLVPRSGGTAHAILGRHRPDGILAMAGNRLYQLSADSLPAAIPTPAGRFTSGTFATDPISGSIFNAANGNLLRLDRDGSLHEVASLLDDDSLFSASSPAFTPARIAFDLTGDMFLADTHNRVRKLVKPAACPSTPVMP